MKVVVIPFLQIELDHSSKIRNIIWCEPKIEPFNQVPFIPVVYGTNLQNTIFSKEYLEEKQKAFIDNLNIAYVAFTRAKQELMVFSKLRKKGDRDSVSISDILYDYCKDELNENLELNLGDWYPAGRHEDSIINEIELNGFQSVPIGERLKLSLKSTDFFDKNSKRNYGLIMHNILSGVFLEDDLSGSIKTSIMNGESREEEYESLFTSLSQMLTSVRDRHWFDGSYKIYNELEIIEPGGAISRPDRVLMGAEAIIIDFKFGSIKSASHKKQVVRYMRLVKGMGLAYVKGYLWYLEENEIEEVKLENI
jgi:hypothetical protein